MSDKITIKKRSPLRGEDGNKVISIRIKEELLARIDALAEESNRSRNEVINLLLRAAASQAQIEE
ncbi:MAG: ribbon-helix-helix protein, CopG family [Oscillospiraceae bacterium]|jgi:metal-responsive CopG/Arc/MetJ family transcriptional regulator|nr:ribbon-helix-helix protein, CopG family [Oscillospiraceae bacterium]